MKRNILLEEIRDKMTPEQSRRYDKAIEEMWNENDRKTSGYKLGQKESEVNFKKKLKDKYNHLNSKLKEVNTFKLDKTVNREIRIILESQVELLKELIKDVDK